MTQGKTQDKVGPQEICILIVFVALSHLLWPKNNRLYDSPGHSVWISALLAGLLGLVLVLAMKRYTQGKGLAGALCESYGNGLGGVFILAFSLYFMLMAAALLARSESEMAYFSYTATDKTIMRVVFALAMMFVALCGIAGVSRTARFAVAILVISAVLMMIFGFQRLETVRLFPLLGEGAGAVAMSAVEMTGCFWSVFAIGALSKHTGKEQKLGRGAMAGVIISALSLAGVFFVMSCAVSSKVYEQAVSPLLYFVSVLKAGRFINKVDSLFISAWVSLAIIAGAFGIQGSAHLMARVTGTENTKPYCVGIAGLIIVISSQMQYTAMTTEILKLAWLPALAIVVVGIIITKIRSGHEKD